MDQQMFEAAAGDLKLGALYSMLCGLVLLVAPGAAAQPDMSTQEVRMDIWEGELRRRELLGHLEALGQPGGEAKPRARGSQRHGLPLVGDRRAPPVPLDSGNPVYEAMDMDLRLRPPDFGPPDFGQAGIIMVEQHVDADGDGRYEEIHFLGPDGSVLRKHIDRNRDGHIDCWRVLHRGRIVAQTLDTNFNQRPDVWEQYASGRTIARQVDRDEDGVRDVFFYYEGDLLVRDEKDMDGDGSIDVRSFYAGGQLVRREIFEPELESP